MSRLWTISHIRIRRLSGVLFWGAPEAELKRLRKENERLQRERDFKPLA